MSNDTYKVDNPYLVTCLHWAHVFLSGMWLSVTAPIKERKKDDCDVAMGVNYCVASFPSWSTSICSFETRFKM